MRDPESDLKFNRGFAISAGIIVILIGLWAIISLFLTT